MAILYAQRNTPRAQRQSPQTGKGLPKQSTSFLSASAQPPQSVQGENSNLRTRSRNAAYSGLSQISRRDARAGVHIHSGGRIFSSL